MISGNDWQILIGVGSIIFSGAGAYLGIRIGLAEIRKDIASIFKDCADMEKRIERLELPFFHK